MSPDAYSQIFMYNFSVAVNTAATPTAYVCVYVVCMCVHAYYQLTMGMA